MKQNIFVSLTVVCYMLATVLWLIEGLLAFLYEGGLPPLNVGLSQAQFVGVQPLQEDHYFVSSTDGQIILEDFEMLGGLVHLDGEFLNYPGELDLYYKKVGQSEYQTNQRVFAFPMEGGGYGYRVPLGTYGGLRIDTGTEADNVLVAESLVLHPQRTPWEYFQFSFRRLLVLLVLPPIASCLIYTIIEWYKLIKKQKREKKA